MQMSLIGNEEKSEKLVCSHEQESSVIQMRCRSYESIKILKINSQTAEKKPVFLQKDKWDKEIEFLLSCISLSVGLGNVWR